MDTRKAKARGKECQGSSLAVLDEELAPLKVDERAFLSTPAYSDALTLACAESEI